MLRLLDNLLNRITMYRLVLYYLLFLLALAEGMSLSGLLPYGALALPLSVCILVAVSWAANKLFARTWGVPANTESLYITALILALIITPLASAGDAWFLLWAAVWAMASKYILAIHKQHIFNPVAFAVALTALTLNQTASWWVGAAPLLPFVLAGSLLIVRKTRRWDSVLAFLGAALFATVVLTVVGRDDLFKALEALLVNSPLVFFAGVIVTEPLTAPPTRRLQLWYGLLVGVLFTPQVHFGPLYFTPELAILIGNAVFYLISPRTRWVLTLTQKIQIAPDIYDFIFVPHRPLAYAPGQYAEWTLGHMRSDSRGNRRYFTLASSPTEENLRVGIKFYPQSSSFKQSLLDLPLNSEIMASQIAGDFVLPGARAVKFDPAAALTPLRMAPVESYGDGPLLRARPVPPRPGAAAPQQAFARPAASSASEREWAQNTRLAQPLALRREPATVPTAPAARQPSGAPRGTQRKVVMIAGGIGITPFRSMVKYLLDTRRQRPLVLIYANGAEQDIVYTDLFKQAERELGMKLVYTLTDRARVSAVWTGRVGYVDTAMLRAEVPDYKHCLFYVSGPNAMVDTTVRALAHLGVHSDQIKTDFFPGLA